MSKKIEKISIVSPIYNEEKNIPLLYDNITQVMNGLSISYEIILINDGSTDGSLDVLVELTKKDKNVSVVDFNKNFGQTEAMMAGFNHATGDVIITMDADLQNDPTDIPALLEKIAEGYDVVSGWRKDRKDHAIKRNFLSRVANKIISYVSGVTLHDYGCTLKAYRRSSTNLINLYGEMHRFIPIYSALTGATVAEIPVKHHPRKFGESKYGMERILKVVLDLIVVRFLSKYFKSPIYIFGKISFVLYFASFMCFLYSVYLKFFSGISFIQTPLPLLAVTCFLTGTMCILLGILAELMMRIYYESQNKKPYVVRNVIKG